MTRSRLAPLPALLLGGLAIIAVGTAVTGWVVGRLVEDWLTAYDGARVVQLVRAELADHVGRATPALTGTAELEAAGRDLLTVPGVFRVKVFDAAGRIVWSDAPELVGRGFRDNPALARALAGETIVDLVRPHRPEHERERHVTRIREVYVPFGPPGHPPIGVVGVYLDTAPLEADVAHARLVLGGISALTALSLGACLAIAVRRVSRALAQALTREREVMEKRLALVERLRAFGEIAAGAAHDLNNVFMVLSGRLQLLVPHAETSPVLARALEPLRKAVTDGLEIMHRLRGLRPGCRQTPLEPVRLNEVVDDVLRIAEPRWQRTTKIEVVPVTSNVPPILGRASELREVVLNLVLNALDAMPDGGRLTVSTTADDGHGVVEVADTGTGIPPEVRRNLFVPFTTTKPEGTGLGLSVSYGIVRRHGGTIEVDSTPGAGSRFVVRLPVAATGVPAAREP